MRIWLVELFALANLAFLSIDIYLAHSANEFANRLEWVPIPFGALALLLVPALLAPHRRDWPRAAGLAVAWAAIVLGIAGLLLHLQGAFFGAQTLESLVYAAPFIAPLSYVGVGMLLLVNRLEAEHEDWGSWVLILAAGGFFGNFALSALDHAQNGMFADVEWVPVAAGAFGFAFLLLVVQRPHDRTLRGWCAVVMVVECVVGVLGTALHFSADMQAPAESWTDRMIFGAPVFAPLLFCNIALLAGIGLWEADADAEADTAVDDGEGEAQHPRMALQAELLREAGILLLTPNGPLTAADFAAATALADPWIEEHGKLAGVLVHVESFPGWEDFAGLSSHLRFVRDHHKEIRRVAVVTDSKLMSKAPALARHFLAAEIRAFESSERDAALAWLSSD
jgi:hypothetical protein